MTQSIQTFAIGEIAIRQFNGLFSLNDLHKAAGGEESQRPTFFLRNEQTKALIAAMEAERLIAVETVIGRGKAQGTYACRELVIAYAAWISAAFHLKVIRVFLAVTAPQPMPYTVQPSDTLSEPQQIALRTLLESNVKRLPQEKQAAAMVGGWSKLKAHFGVPYRQIPASEFTEALSIIARHVSQWELLDAPQQTQPAKAPTMFGRQWLVSTDMNGKETVRPVAPDQFVKSFREIARGIAVGDMELSTAELIDLASACNQRLVHRLGNPALVLAV